MPVIHASKTDAEDATEDVRHSGLVQPVHSDHKSSDPSQIHRRHLARVSCPGREVGQAVAHQGDQVLDRLVKLIVPTGHLGHA
jgi:hypothetical protein